LSVELNLQTKDDQMMNLPLAVIWNFEIQHIPLEQI